MVEMWVYGLVVMMAAAMGVVWVDLMVGKKALLMVGTMAIAKAVKKASGWAVWSVAWRVSE